MLDEKLDVIYMRVSKEDGDVTSGTEDESCSIQSQRHCIWQYIYDHPDLTGNYEELIDDGYTGTNFNRPGMIRLLKMVESGLVRNIIVRDLSRFARNYLEAGHILEFVFPIFHVRFISINDHFDSKDYGESTGGFQLAIKNLINQWYSNDISQKIKSSVNLKKMAGEYVYGTAPYGYKKGPKSNTIVVDLEVAHYVRQIFQWAVQGVTISQIARKLNEANVQPPSQYLKRVRGKYKVRPYWTYESVRNILNNRIYTGDTVPYKSHVIRVGSNRVKMIPEDEQIVIPDTHEAIVSRKEYFQAREVVKTNKKSKPRGSTSLLAPFLVCSHCGNKLHKGRASNQNFRCTTARYVPDSPCAQILVNEKRVEDIVLRAIQKQCELLNLQLKEKKQALFRIRDEAELLQKELNECNRRVSRSQSANMKHYEDYVSGKISREEFLERKAIETQKKENAKARALLVQAKLERIPKRQMALEDDAIDLASVSQFGSIDVLTPELLKKLLKKIIVYPDGEIEIIWNFRDELLFELIGKENVS